MAKRQSAATERAIRDALRTAAQAVVRDVDEIAGDIADVLTRDVPEISDDAETRDDILLRGRLGLLAWAGAFVRGIEPPEVEPPVEAYAYARTLARRGVPLDVLLRIHRLSLGVLLQAWEDRLGRLDTADALLTATKRSIEVNFRFHDVTMAALSAEYQRERERWVRGAEAVRRETIDGLLGDEPLSTNRASSILRYELRRHHVGLVLWAEPTADDPQVIPLLEQVAADSAAFFDADKALTLPDGASTMWAWIGSDAEIARDQLDGFTSRRNTDGVSIAVGAPGSGVVGFRRTHRDAVDTARVAVLSGRRPGTVIGFGAVQLAALLAGDLDRTRRFVGERLGSLARDDDEAARLRATLLIYLEENGSRLATAERIGVHPNTVANRIRSCREMLDRDIGRDQVLLMAALSLAATLGPAVLIGAEE